VIITSLQKALNDEGHFVTTAQGGQAGIDAFAAAREQGDPFAVVITDLGMPYVDGRKVAAAIRATSSTPIILLTGWGHSLIAEKDVPAGVDRVLSKPPRLTDLRVTLAELTQSVAPLTVS
jgi:CheY-like chemotaxis protein